MPIKTACPKCRTSLTLNDEQARAAFPCPSCGVALRPSANRGGEMSTAGTTGLPAAAPPATPPPAATGKTIGPYEVRRELGRGAFGIVFLGYDRGLDREVAIKLLNRTALGSRQAVERFVREARVVAQMHHNHIVPVYQLGEHAGAHFIASKFITGRTLADAVPDDGMDPAQAVGLVIQLLDALAYAHGMNVLHRDVKPANAMLDATGQLYLMDFGLAGWVGQADARMTRDGAVMGTPAYMAPEQAAGKTAGVGFAADQYSAGVVLFKLLTGRLPFDAPAQVFAYHVIHTPPPRPTDLRPGLDPRLEEICLKALAKDPGQRFASCKEFAGALRGWRESLDGIASPTAPAARSAADGPAAAVGALPSTEPPATPPTPTQQTEWPETLGVPFSAGFPQSPPVDLRSAHGSGLSARSWVAILSAAVALPLLTVIGIVAVKTVGTAIPPEGARHTDTTSTARRPIADHQGGLGATPPDDRLVPAPDNKPGVDEQAGASRTDYTSLATGRWTPLLPSVAEFDRLCAAKAFTGPEPTFANGLLQLHGGPSRLIFDAPVEKDAIIRAKAKYLGKYHQDKIMLGLRFQKGDYVAAFFNGDFKIGKNRVKRWTELASCKSHEKYQDFFELAFAARGNNLSLYVDGRKILGVRTTGAEVSGFQPNEPAYAHVGGFGVLKDIEIQVIGK